MYNILVHIYTYVHFKFFPSKGVVVSCVSHLFSLPKNLYLFQQHSTPGIGRDNVKFNGTSTNTVGDHYLEERSDYKFQLLL